MPHNITSAAIVSNTQKITNSKNKKKGSGEVEACPNVAVTYDKT